MYQTTGRLTAEETTVRLFYGVHGRELITKEHTMLFSQALGCGGTSFSTFL